MTQPLIVLTALTEDVGAIPSPYMVAHRFVTLFCSPRALNAHGTQTCTQSKYHTCKK